MNKVEIQIVEPESVQTRIEGRFHALRPMIGIPQFCGNEDVLARDSAGGKTSLQSLAYFTLVPVSLRTVEVSKPGFQCVSGGGYRYNWIGNQGAKSECGYRAAPVVKRHSRQSKIRRFIHGDTSLFETWNRALD
jgi:hypothetical protein